MLIEHLHRLNNGNQIGRQDRFQALCNLVTITIEQARGNALPTYRGWKKLVMQAKALHQIIIPLPGQRLDQPNALRYG